MSRVRNADEFLRVLGQVESDYQEHYGPLIANLRTQYAGQPAPVHALLDESLEAHARTYVVNALLRGLNWRLDRDLDDDLPSMVPEVPVRSQERQTVRFLDYLGFQRDTLAPLLIVETKRPGSTLPLPSTWLSDSGSGIAGLALRSIQAQAVIAGLNGTPLSGDWSSWLRDLRDYTRSVATRHGAPPRRVVITNGDWLIVFLNPEAAFLGNEAYGPEHLLIAESRAVLRDRAAEVFDALEHQRVLGELPALEPGNLAFYLDGVGVDRVLHGLRVRYEQMRRIRRSSPTITVVPVLYVRTEQGTWLRVEGHIDCELPHDEAGPNHQRRLRAHLLRVHEEAMSLLTRLTDAIGMSVTPTNLQSHYDDAEAFAALPGTREVGEGEYLLVTGSDTHFLRSNLRPWVQACRHHDWVASNKVGMAAGEQPILMRSVIQKAFFTSREAYHCAHSDVAAAKSAPITLANKASCGQRSRGLNYAFCEIFAFETHLCCRACAFEQVCTKATVFALPCIQTH